ncbi:ATP synthase subunit I [Candidatus Avoscillospira sp. LCP25S3_F1]|uniref:ATP synthase subunit I n=1 Tax=Candidatus Avoscillospira sp. LCP25S3_F1 TaxID=3438825 RepID=UPI003F8DA489
MHLQPATRREIKRISTGVLLGSALMVAVFAVLGRFSWPVLWGALLGDTVAIGNFVFLGISVQKAAAAEELRGRQIMQFTYSLRMLIVVAALALSMAVEVFYWLTVLIPLLLPRITILVLQITGAYKPDKGANEVKGE